MGIFNPAYGEVYYKAIDRLNQIEAEILSFENERNDLLTFISVYNHLNETPVKAQGEGVPTTPPSPDKIQEPLTFEAPDPLRSVSATRKDAELVAPDGAEEADAPPPLPDPGMDAVEPSMVRVPQSLAGAGEVGNASSPEPEENATANAAQQLHEGEVLPASPSQMAPEEPGGPSAPAEEDEPASSANPDEPDHTDPTISIRGRIRRLHKMHPEFDSYKAAAALGISSASIRSFSRDMEISWGAVPMPPKASAGTFIGSLRDKVVLVHRQYPAWTATMIAKHLGANRNSVSTYLAAARDPERS